MKAKSWVQLLTVSGVDCVCSRLVSMLCVMMGVVWWCSWVWCCDGGGALWWVELCVVSLSRDANNDVGAVAQECCYNPGFLPNRLSRSQAVKRAPFTN